MLFVPGMVLYLHSILNSTHIKIQKHPTFLVVFSESIYIELKFSSIPSCKLLIFHPVNSCPKIRTIFFSIASICSVKRQPDKYSRLKKPIHRDLSDTYSKFSLQPWVFALWKKNSPTYKKQIFLWNRSRNCQWNYLLNPSRHIVVILAKLTKLVFPGHSQSANVPHNSIY